MSFLNLPFYIEG